MKIWIKNIIIATSLEKTLGSFSDKKLLAPNKDLKLYRDFNGNCTDMMLMMLVMIMIIVVILMVMMIIDSGDYDGVDDYEHGDSGDFDGVDDY